MMSSAPRIERLARRSMRGGLGDSEPDRGDAGRAGLSATGGGVTRKSPGTTAT
jgi:hypothetical protein